MNGQERIACIIIVAGALASCSTVMEAERPAATRLDQFAVGQKRVDVIAQVGPPLSTVQDDNLSCDVYKMHTKGTNAAGKTGIIVTEAAADFFTLGLAEAVLTPAEAASKAGLHTVMFCYDADQQLAVMRDAGQQRNIGAVSQTSRSTSTSEDVSPPTSSPPASPSATPTASKSSN